MGLREDIGRRIAEVRESLGLTQEELAARVGMSARRVRHIEAGQNIQLDTLERVAAALAVHARVLLDPPSARQALRRPGRPRKARAYEVSIDEADAAVADVAPEPSRRTRKPSR